MQQLKVHEIQSNGVIGRVTCCQEESRVILNGKETVELGLAREDSRSSSDHFYASSILTVYGDMKGWAWFWAVSFTGFNHISTENFPPSLLCARGSNNDILLLGTKRAKLYRFVKNF